MDIKKSLKGRKDSSSQGHTFFHVVDNLVLVICECKEVIVSFHFKEYIFYLEFFKQLYKLKLINLFQSNQFSVLYQGIQTNGT